MNSQLLAELTLLPWMLVLRMAAVLTGSGSAASHPVDNEVGAIRDIHGSFKLHSSTDMYAPIFTLI